MNAQWSFNPGIGTGIESPTNTASGDYSTAMGYYTTANGSYSTAMGNHTTASGNYSSAMGYYTTASGNYSSAKGTYTIASALAANSMGNSTIASGDGSTTMGYGTTAEDLSTLAIGHYNTAEATANPTSFDLSNTALVIGNGTNDSNRSDAVKVLFDGTTTIAGPVTATSFIGDGSGLTNLPDGILSYNSTSTTGIESPTNTASGDYSVAMGQSSTASGNWSTAMGSNTTAYDLASTTIGHWNTDDITPNPDSFSLANKAFVIGNGFDGIRSDAMTVLFDGTTTIAGDLTINSDARLKSNIISLGGTLNKLLALDGKSYTLKADESKQKIGLLAQDVQEVFPELVTKASDEQGTLSVNYQGLIPVLINAIKEQQKEIEELKIEVNKLRNQ